MQDDNTKKKKEQVEEIAEKKAEEDLADVLEKTSVDKITDLTNKITELEDQLKRSVADYRNLEKRVSEEKLEFIKFANKNLFEELLPAFDTLLLAEKYTEDNNLKITVKHVLEVLKNSGIEKVETVGKTYDPKTMEAIEVVDGKEEKVIEETQPGFIFNGKILRPARVKVGGKVGETV